MEEKQKQIEQGFVDYSGNLHQGFWQTYIKNGARVMRHNGSVDSARRIVDNIIICSTPIYIQIQDEVAAGKDLVQTAAGQEIMSDLERGAEKMSKELANLKAEMEDTLRNTKEDNKDLLKQEFEEEISLIEEKRQAVLSERIKMWQADNPRLTAEIGALVVVLLGQAFEIAVKKYAK